MDKLIESLLNINIRKNEGYIFVKQEDIYVPIIKTVLSITKRSFYRLPLLEEIVLRLINENLQEIDELANVLGIDRKLLEVTLADLSVKDIIYCTTNRCTLLSKGKQALKDLRTVQRRKDTIKNIYLDPINKKIITDYDNYQFIDKVVYNNDKKLEADITVNNIEIFKENIESVNKVFLDEMNLFNDKTKSEPDELLSIDGIENVFVKFIRIPMNIFVSADGYDIDVLASSKKYDTLFKMFKDEIIEQIRRKKLLKKLFVKYKPRREFTALNLQENENLKKCLLKCKNNKSDRNELRQVIEKEIFLNRKLMDEEFEYLLKYLSAHSQNIKIVVHNLNDWIKSDLYIEVKTILNGKTYEIGYDECNDWKNAISAIKRDLPNCTKDQIKKVNKDFYFFLNFDDKYNIIAVPKDILIIDNKTHIHMIEFYFQILIH